MPRPTDTTLLGTYATPAFNYGDVVFCELRGEVTLAGLREGPIPWPVGKKGRHKALVLYAGLADAVRRESAAAVMRWWRVGSDKVWKWRQALGVGPTTEGTSRLRAQAEHLPALLARARSSPLRAAGIAAAKRGVPRSPESARATGRGHLGMRHTPEARRKMSLARKGGSGRGRSWTAEEDELVRTLTPQEAAKRTGRTVKAVWSRRAKLGVNRAEG
jgi:hypothetical protein